LYEINRSEGERAPCLPRAEQICSFIKNKQRRGDREKRRKKANKRTATPLHFSEYRRFLHKFDAVGRVDLQNELDLNA
jgi:hypothetical protein